jgi:hypothetical protein
VMATSLDKFYRMCVDTHKRLPEPFLAKCALSVSQFSSFAFENGQ